MYPLPQAPLLATRTADHLERVVLSNLPAGARLPSVRTLADRFGVSVPTLREAQRLLADKGRLTIRHGSGVYVAEAAVHRRIGILSELDLFDSRISPHWRGVAGAVKTQLETAGHTTQLYIGRAEPGPGASDNPTCPQFWTDAAAGKLDGAVILDVPSSDAWFGRIYDCPIPVVGAMTPYTASADLTGIVRAAVARLAAQGCRRLGLIAWHGEAAFLEAVKGHGLATSDAWMRTDLDPASRGAGWEQFRELWLQAAEKPDGLVILDDMLAADAQLAMLELGVRVPRELRLAVATNRHASPPLRLPLTAFECDPAEMAAELVTLLQQRLAGKLTAPVSRLVPFREIVVDAAVTPELVAVPHH